MLKSFYTLLRHEFVAEWRQMFALGSLLLYVFSSVFIVFVSLMDLSPQLWVTLFWIIMIFVSVNSIMKNFHAEGERRVWYYYSIASPIAVFLSKATYNYLLLMLLGVLCLLGMAVIGGWPIRHNLPFAAAFILGNLGISFSFTLLGKMASIGKQSNTLIAVLGFPVIIPVLVQLIQVSLFASGQSTLESANNDLLLLLAIDLLILSVSLLLFPYLWRR